MEAPVDIWSEYGFGGNPYSTDPIAPSASDRQLLVGRAAELAKIARQFAGGAAVVALEGDFGVGKTSLAASAAYDASLWVDSGGPLFVVADTRLSLRTDDSRESFEGRTIRAVASALVAASGRLKDFGRALQGVDGVSRWLKSPETGGWSASANASAAGFGGGLGVGRSRAANTTHGFSEVGLTEIVDNWLRELFPDRKAGGVICVLDNLEELQDSATALRVMEPLRDPLFKRTGLRWIVSGAQGMVRAAYSSPKMTGVFLNPIEVAPLRHEDAPKVVAARASALSIREDAVPPVSATAFAEMYGAIGNNLRYALNLAERYAFDQDPVTIGLLTEAERDARFEQELAAEADRTYQAHAKGITRADWTVFETLLREKSGACSPSDFANFGYSAMPPLLVRVQKLEAANLVTYTVDPQDQRRRTISVTDHGRLAYYRRITR